jgi:hypothetical protein
MSEEFIPPQTDLERELPRCPKCGRRFWSFVRRAGHTKCGKGGVGHATPRRPITGQQEGRTLQVTRIKASDLSLSLLRCRTTPSSISQSRRAKVGRG